MAHFQNCDDFATATTEQSPAYLLADKLGFEETFKFNRAFQGATHALASRINLYPEDEYYNAGYEAAYA